MKEYWALFDFSGYICESISVEAKNKRDVRRIMKDHYGTNVRIREIHEEPEVRHEK